MTSWDDRESQFEEHPLRTAIKWGAGVLVFGLVLALLYIPAHFALGWFSAASNVAGPANVQAQFHAVITDWNAMKVEADNYCQAKDAKTNANSPMLVEDPALAYAAKYRSTSVDYNARMNNIFEAGAVGPPGYPNIAPTLERAANC